MNNCTSAIRVIRVIRWQLLLPPLAPPREPAGYWRSFDSAHASPLRSAVTMQLKGEARIAER